MRARGPVQSGGAGWGKPHPLSRPALFWGDMVPVVSLSPQQPWLRADAAQKGQGLEQLWVGIEGHQPREAAALVWDGGAQPGTRETPVPHLLPALWPTVP